MTQKTKIIFITFLIVDAALVAICFREIVLPRVHFGGLGFFNPQGVIAFKERGVFITAFLIMMIAVVPVYFLIFFFAWKYRANNTGAKYSPELQSGPVSTFILWAIPIVVIFAVGVLNWNSTHDLDPTKPIVSAVPPITIEVVALQWKWLFIYPAQNIATMNFVEFPVNTPVNFELTADAPMSSFWIPQLGSQIYAMAAMSTHLNLIADKTGDFSGKNTEINGIGFSGMKFVARSASQVDFNSWVKSTQSSNNALNIDVYNQLAKPSENNPVASYSSVQNNLYNQIMTKYMSPLSATGTSSQMMIMPGMDTK